MIMDELQEWADSLTQGMTIPKYNPDTLQAWGFTKWTEAMMKDYQKSQKKRRPGIHVTDLCYPCYRRMYYKNKYSEKVDDGIVPGMRADEVLRLWIGMKLHELPLTDHHELSLSWNGKHGTVDEYDSTTGFFLDKKTTRAKSNRYLTAREQYVLQGEYYRVLLENNGYPARGFVILYINVATSELKTVCMNILRRPLSETEEEAMIKKTTLESHLEINPCPARLWRARLRKTRTVR